MLDNIRLIRHNEVTGSLYFELQPGQYQGECWTDGSVFITEEVFGYLESVLRGAAGEARKVAA